MDLSTRYLGLELAHPLLAGASPLADSLDSARRLEDAGAAAIVLRSLFEEQIEQEQLATSHAFDQPAYSSPEASSYLPLPSGMALGPDEHLEHLQRVKAAVSVPLIASLNGTSLGGWLAYARMMEEAGADALELNVYQLATGREDNAERIEGSALAMVSALTEALMIPVAVKLSPFYTALAHFAGELDEAGADGLVLFNRFYQADIDVEALEVTTSLRLSDRSELLLRLRWLAILSGRQRASLACSGGVHTAEDVVKALLCGAHAVQLVSALLQHGPGHLGRLRDEVARWLEEHGYESVEEMRGAMSLERCPDPRHFERVHYMRVLQSWRPQGS
ncbi:MAG TPA: dihydroorotate dehydrogenase-like protein [Thermoanaerobaculia bacterium]|nr:dihydroorotate dehydrogenase-like protein [Thermoanaerobaculia bacterium]